MKRKIDEIMFNKIKEALNTKILMYPSRRYIANKFGYHSGTISMINQSKTYKDYKERQKKYRMNIDLHDYEEIERAKKIVEDFNNEWYFDETNH